MSIRPLRLLSALLFLSTSTSAGQSTDSLFTYVGRVDFPPDIVIATIDHVSRHADRLVIVDRTGQQAFLFSIDGSLLRALDISACDPGAKFTPQSAAINGEYIFVVSNGPWGFSFDASGTCIAKAHQDYRPRRHQIFDRQRRLVGIRVAADQSLFLEGSPMATPAGEVTPLPPSPYPIADVRIQGGGLAETSHAFYFTPSVSPVLYRLGRDGVATMIDLSDSFTHSPPKQDLPAGRPTQDGLRAGGEIVLTNTRNMGLAALSDNALLAQYWRMPDDWQWVVIDTVGDHITRVEAADFGFILVADGFGYRLVQPDMHEDGNFPNPHLRVYQLQPPRQFWRRNR